MDSRSIISGHPFELKTDKKLSTMMKAFKTILITAVAILATVFPCVAQTGDAITMTSPNGNLVMKFALTDGVPTYSLDYCGQAVILLHAWVSSSREGSN